ncbi:MAG: HAD-IA family hydrolase, partial [Rhodospirillales bacterium]|nr:HAD-IA family hydrolase [Rhodospirillales bacterium]
MCSPAGNLRQDAGRSWAEGITELTGRWPRQAALIRAFDERWEKWAQRRRDHGACPRFEGQRRAALPLTNFSSAKFELTRRRFDVFALFDGIVVSGEIGLVKSDPAIFRHLLQRFRLSAGQCLFVDDAPANVEGRAGGRHAPHLFRSA